jgi:hypothetical protein
MLSPNHREKSILVVTSILASDTLQLVTMTKKRGSGRGRGRPKRQRTPTTLYSDDNPSTFTTKKKKNGDFSQPQPSPPPSPPSRSQIHSDFFDDGLPLKRSYRKKKNYNRHSLVSTTFRRRAGLLSEDESNEEEEVPEVKLPPLTTSPGRKRRRPSGFSESKAEAAPTQNDRNTSKVSSSESSSTPFTQKSLMTHPRHDTTGTFLAHAVKVAPILPSALDGKSPNQLLEQQYPRVFGNGLGKSNALERADWTPLYSPDVFFDDDYSSDDNRGLDPSILPVTRSISCITTRKPDHQYMAVGDDAGFCIIYSMGTHIRPVARLEPVACQQRSRHEQERIREQIRKTKGKLRSLVKDTTDITIHAIGMVASRVVLATSCELECMDVPSQTSLWVCPLTADRRVTSLDVHMSTYDVLVSCNILKQATNSNRNAIPLAQAASSPLMLLQHSRNNIEICDANSPLLVKSPCCTAIWDASKSAENRLLFVTVSDTDQELELVLVQGGSIDNWKVACKTRIPVKASNHQTRLCQSPEGIYTLVACSRGIRLYQTETLQLINTYGDQLALHGKSVVWQDCLLLNSNQFTKHVKKLANNLICDDWLATDDDDDKKDDNQSDLGPYVVGVPSFKGPKELCETLHVWKLEQASTVPTLSIPLPPKAEGVKGLVACPIMGNDRLVLATRSGVGHTLLPRMESNFAGIMYPPGYHVVSDSLEYIEDEDELDVEEQSPEPEEVEENVDVLADSEEMDEDLREAMRQSLLEKKFNDAHQAQDEDVDILSRDDVEDGTILPCRPEPYLRQAVNGHDDEESDTEKSSAEDQEEQKEDGKDSSEAAENTGPMFIEKILDCMPNAHKKKELSEDGITVSVTKVIVATMSPMPNRPGRGKRSRAANLEAVLKASVNPRLQKYMISKENIWTDGSGSTLCPELNQENLSEAKVENTELQQVTPSPAGGEDGNAAGIADKADGCVEVAWQHPNRDKASSEEQKTDNGNKGGVTSLNTKIRSDEAAVALGLLGLSPCNTEPRSTSPTNASEPVSRSSSIYHPMVLNHIVYNAPESTSTSDTASDIGSKTILMDRQEYAQEARSNCYACRGRYVVHSCGKRALPIDYDEVAKAERERKEKEEEEKKKARAEKRRLADARRREARKLKQRELEEQRRREEEEEKYVTIERLRLAEEAYARPQVQASVLHSMQDHLQGGLMASSYSDNVSSYQQPQATRAVETLTADDSSRLQNESYLAQQITRKNWDNSTAANQYAEHETTTVTQTAPVGRKASIGTLSSADALIALASFAGSNLTNAAPYSTQVSEAAQSAQSLGAYESVPYGATHNFGAGVPVAAAPEPKRSIPTFASLQANGAAGTCVQLGDETKMNSAAGAAGTEAFNGSLQTGGFVWPPVSAESYPSRNYSPTVSDAYSRDGGSS